MNYRRFLAYLPVFCLIALSGCNGAASPAYTLKLDENPSEVYSPRTVAPSGRVVLAEVFTYDE